MAIEIKETFVVAAPIDAVWRFMNDPQNVVSCMPGATLKEVLDERRFVGTVKIKIGAVTAQYQGTITYQEADAANHHVVLLAEGNERGGGTVSGTIDTLLVAIPGGGTEVRCTSSVDLTGKIVQVGRGMIEGVSAQIIRKYVANVKALLEVPGPAEAPAQDAPASAAAVDTPAVTSSPSVVAPPAKEETLDVGSVVFAVLWKKLADFFRRLVGRR
ncbi:MAG: SRPBCC family protein [Steroidobacteraceae bacterium]